MSKWQNKLCSAGRLSVLVFLSACILFGCAAPAIQTQTGQSNGTYPLQTEETLTYWVPLNDNLRDVSDDLGETPFAQELARQTGVKINYIHPQQANGWHPLTLLLASGDLPDIIEYSWSAVPGGIQKTYLDNHIIRLNDVIDKWSPNLKAYLQDHPDVDNMAQTDNGDYLFYPLIRESEDLTVHTGPMIRGDWLEELGLEVPETIGEWHQALTLMKQQKGADAPLVYENNLYSTGDLSGAFGVKQGFYVENGQVVYGAAQPGYKAFLQTFRQWYGEGLIDPDIVSVDKLAVESNIAQGKSAATVALAGNGMGRFNRALQQQNPNYRMVAAPHPVLNKGETPKFGQRGKLLDMSGSSTCITTSCKNVELAARFLDFGYTEQGKLLYNFGILGESYEMRDGQPAYTDKILHPQQGDVGAAIALYARGNQSGPFIQMQQYQMQYYQMPEQREAVEVWRNSNTLQYDLPELFLTVEEIQEVAQIQEALNGYVNDMTNRFLLGLEPIEQFDTVYQETLQALRLPRVLEIYQQAYTRHQNR